MTGVRSEPRTAMMAIVELSWEELHGTTHGTIRATMEDTSRSGARIRANTAISVGATVWVKRPWEEIAGVTKYCRRDGLDYVFGIQRILDWKERKTFRSDGVSHKRPEPNTFAKQDGPLTTKETHSAMGAADNSSGPLRRPRTDAAPNLPRLAIPSNPNPSEKATPLPEVHSPARPISVRSSPAKDRQEPQPPSGSTGPAQHAEALSADKERRRMSTSWLGMTFRRQKEESSNGKSIGSAAGDGTTVENTATEHSGGNGIGNSAAKLRGDLQSPEDIYRAAGILNPRMGYSIHKVVEMIHSDHMRSVPREAKRAAILMALDAASVSVEEILRDATQRREALQSYEAAQRKSFEEYWARKAESNTQIQAETDRIVALNMERIQRNEEEVSREKAEFAKWQAMNRKEAERIMEAVELCSNAPTADADADSSPPLSEAVSGGKSS